MRVFHPQGEAHPILGQQPFALPYTASAVQFHHQGILPGIRNQAPAAILLAVGMLMPAQMLRVNADFAQYPIRQKVQEAQIGLFPDAGADHGTGHAVVKKRRARLMHDVHVEKRFLPVGAGDGRLLFHARPHGRDVPHPQLIPPGFSRGVAGVFGEDVGQPVVQRQQAFLHRHAERHAGHGFGQRLAAMDLTGAIRGPVSLHRLDAMAHNAQSVHFRAGRFQGI